MGIFLAPMLIAMLGGFSFFGLKFGFLCLAKSRSRLNSAITLLVISIVLATLAIVLPFAVMASSRVSAFGFLFASSYAIAGIAAFGSIYLRERYRQTERTIFGLTAAALCFSAASFPVTWFWLSERMSGWFRLTWSY